MNLKRNNLIFSCLLFGLIPLSVQGDTESVSVRVKSGSLIGERRGHFYAFEGIPYAEAPLGGLRFEPPQPYTQTWVEPRDARHVGSICMQWDHFSFDVEDKLRGSEDCLFLNVYTPSLEKGKKMPVFVYIHGGAFIFGNGDYYGPNQITEREGVMVNLNYRLGPLGFLTTENELVPGNMGLKDQVVALKWIQENIAVFGGDPDRVTTTGWSAGGASVHLHYLSPLSVGLFKNGISHSGCALDPWVFMEKGIERTEKLASIVGCPTTSEMVACLKGKPANDLVRAVKQFQPWLFNPFSPFGATIEPKSDGAFISESPLSLIKSGKFQHKPWIASATQAEGLYPAAEYRRHEQYLDDIETRWNEIVPFILHYNDTISPGRLNEVSQTIRHHYLKDLKVDDSSFARFVDILSDRLYKYGLSQSIRWQGTYSPTYFYHFEYKTLYSYGEFMSNSNKNLGVAHSEDITLLYKAKLRGDEYPYGAEERRMIELLLDMYYTFSETGKPSLGSYHAPASDSEAVLKYTFIGGPDALETKTSSDYGEEAFWMSLCFDEFKE